MGGGLRHLEPSIGFAPDEGGSMSWDHLANAAGILQADGYKGYAKLYALGPDGLPSFTLGFCWRTAPCFHDFWASGLQMPRSPRGRLDRVGKLYDV